MKYTPTWPRTRDNHTLSPNSLATKAALSLGVLVELCLVFQEFLEEEPIELVKELSVTCAVEEECSLLLRSGEDGTERST